MLIHEFLRRNAEVNPERPAVVHLGKRMTYGELDILSDAFAAQLIQRGVKKGDRVALFLDNSCEYLIAYFGILKTGAVAAALNNQLSSSELSVILADSGPRGIVIFAKYSRAVTEAMSLAASAADLFVVDRLDLSAHSGGTRFLCDPCLSGTDLGMLLYTSGTTGKPKGVMLSHANLAANAASIVDYLHLTADDRVMVVLPFYYSYGTSLLTTHMMAGATLVLDNRFLYPNAILDVMVREEVTGFAGVPSHYAILLRRSALRQYEFPSLRYVTQAGGAMAPDMIREFLSLVPAVRFYVMYGQTEACARLSYLDPDMLDVKPGSIGKAIPGVELDVVDGEGRPVAAGEVGEIVARGQNIMLGYWNDPAETARVLRPDGLRTGDLGKKDEDGFLYLVSRKKDMIKSGANRISLLEIEHIVSGLAGVHECAAVGMADEILGEAIKLFVVPASGRLTEKEVKVCCWRNLASYKQPKEIVFVESLPRTSSGKIKREELRLMADANCRLR
jgi:acyl-CoA synthetase (AMP-forming)/AMP-acid ligase II